MQKPQDLPNYRHPSYAQIVEPLEVLLDTYNNLEGRKAAYLPQEEQELDRVYNNRLQRAEFNNKIRAMIDGSAGLLSNFELTDTPATIEAALNDIDGKGTDYKSFFLEADTYAVRDRLAYVLVDYPEVDVENQTLADQMAAQRRPYLTLIDRRKVYNWRYHYESGKLILDRIVFSTSLEQAEGQFGAKEAEVYHQLDRVKKADPITGQPIYQVQHKIWELVVENGKQQAIAKTSKTIDLDEIPIVAYPQVSKPFDVSPPRFLKAARLNIKLFRKESALDEIEYRVNAPTVYRKWPQSVPEQPTPIVFGSSWIIEIPGGGDVGILELKGAGIAQLQNTISLLQQQIESEGVAFLTGSTIERTATEAYLTSAQAQSTLQAFARHKSSAIKRIFDIWCKYTDEQNSVQITMDANLLEAPLDASEMGVLLQWWSTGAIDHETLLELAKTGKQLPPSLDVQQILQRAQEERAQQVQEATDRERQKMEMDLAASAAQAEQQAQIAAAQQQTIQP